MGDDEVTTVDESEAPESDACFEFCNSCGFVRVICTGCTKPKEQQRGFGKFETCPVCGANDDIDGNGPFVPLFIDGNQVG